MSDARTHFCDNCQLGWPRVDDDGCYTAEFEVCPKCGRATRQSPRPWTYETFADSMSEKNHLLFEAYYETSIQEDRKMLERVEGFAFAQYLMDAAEEYYDRDLETLRERRERRRVLE